MHTDLITKSRAEIAAAYRSPGWWYDLRGFGILSLAYRNTVCEQVRFFGQNMGARHLEVAIGTGTLFDLVLRWRRLQNMAPAHTIGIDYADAMLAGAQSRFSHNADVTLKHADAAALPFADGAFDSVNIANAVHCFPDLDGSVREALRVLKPNGSLAANVLLYPRSSDPFAWVAHRINAFGMRKGILVSPHDPEAIRARLALPGAKIVSEYRSGNAYNVVLRKEA